jgi:hypothetical protein
VSSRSCFLEWHNQITRVLQSIFGTIPIRLDDRLVLGPASQWNLHLSVREHKLVIVVASIASSPVGLVMFMFSDTIFVSMSMSHHRNDTVDQQERARHLWPYLPLESIHHRSGHLTLCRAYITVILSVHHYIVSPATLFRVLWRTNFKNRRISSHGSSSHHLRHLQPKTSKIYTNAVQQARRNPGDPHISPEDPQMLHRRSGETQETHTAGPRIIIIPTYMHKHPHQWFVRLSTSPCFRSSAYALTWPVPLPSCVFLFTVHSGFDESKRNQVGWLLWLPNTFRGLLKWTWRGPRFHKENKTRALLTGVEGDVFLSLGLIVRNTRDIRNRSRDIRNRL